MRPLETGLNKVKMLICSSLDFVSVSFIGIMSTIHSRRVNVDATLISSVALGGYLLDGFQPGLFVICNGPLFVLLIENSTLFIIYK